MCVRVCVCIRVFVYLQYDGFFGHRKSLRQNSAHQRACTDAQHVLPVFNVENSCVLQLMKCVCVYMCVFVCSCVHLWICVRLCICNMTCFFWSQKSLKLKCRMKCSHVSLVVPLQKLFESYISRNGNKVVHDFFLLQKDRWDILADLLDILAFSSFLQSTISTS